MEDFTLIIRIFGKKFITLEFKVYLYIRIIEKKLTYNER